MNAHQRYLMNSIARDSLFEVDHAYIWVKKDSPGIALLQQLGIQVDPLPAVHVGQGTASRCFFFKNMYLELMWVADEEELSTYEATINFPIGPPHNWEQEGTSPFGIGLHYQDEDGERLPLNIKEHRAGWMPDNSYIDLVHQATRYTPYAFILYSDLTYRSPFEPESNHELGIEKMTDLCFTVTQMDNLDPLSHYLCDHNIICFKQGGYPLMELTFDHRRQGKTFDLRPTLPLIINC
jgi:hypothetical protein